jgi:hypothetical protein
MGQEVAVEPPANMVMGQEVELVGPEGMVGQAADMAMKEGSDLTNL